MIRSLLVEMVRLYQKITVKPEAPKGIRTGSQTMKYRMTKDDWMLWADLMMKLEPEYVEYICTGQRISPDMAYQFEIHGIEVIFIRRELIFRLTKTERYGQ